MDSSATLTKIKSIPSKKRRIIGWDSRISTADCNMIQETSWRPTVSGGVKEPVL